MNQAQLEIKKAVAAGYWQTYRYNPEAEKKFTLDSKDPTESYLDFIKGENRYASLTQTFPEEAERLFERGKEDALRRFGRYRRMTQDN